MQIEKVDYTNSRIDKLESLINPTPPRWDQGSHYIAMVENEDVGYLQIVPLIWLGGMLTPVPKSYWLYIARLVTTHPKYLASLLRSYYSISTEIMYPVTLISKPTPGEAEIFNARLGYKPAPFGGDWLVKHCQDPTQLPLQRKPNRPVTL